MLPEIEKKLPVSRISAVFVRR